MNNEYISINDIASEIYDHPLMQDISMERIVRDTIELMKVTNSPTLFDNREAMLHVHKHKATLPCDYYDVNQVVLFNSMSEFECTNHSNIELLDILKQKLSRAEDADEIKNLHLEIMNVEKILRDSAHLYITNTLSMPTRVAVKPATSTFSPMSTPGIDLIYKIQGRTLTTSLPEGDLIISYKAIKIDSEGYPMIINNASFIRALKAYIKKNWFSILFDEGKINGNVLDNAQREYYAYIGQAQASLLDFNEEKAEVISRILNNPYIDAYEWNKTYRDLNKANALKLH